MNTKDYKSATIKLNNISTDIEIFILTFNKTKEEGNNAIKLKMKVIVGDLLKELQSLRETITSWKVISNKKHNER